jgi:hypothetical protein
MKSHFTAKTCNILDVDFYYFVTLDVDVDVCHLPTVASSKADQRRGLLVACGGVWIMPTASRSQVPAWSIAVATCAIVAIGCVDDAFANTSGGAQDLTGRGGEHLSRGRAPVDSGSPTALSGRAPACNCSSVAMRQNVNIGSGSLSGPLVSSFIHPLITVTCACACVCVCVLPWCTCVAISHPSAHRLTSMRPSTASIHSRLPSTVPFDGLRTARGTSE